MQLVLSARVQAVGCVVLVTKALNRFQASPLLTCGGQSRHRTGCSPSTSVCAGTVVQKVFHIRSFAMETV